MVGGMILVLGNRHTWPPFLAFFFAYAAMGNQMLWIVPYLRDVYGLGTTQAALYASAPALAMLVSGPLTGYLSDRVVRRRKAALHRAHRRVAASSGSPSSRRWARCRSGASSRCSSRWAWPAAPSC